MIVFLLRNDLPPFAFASCFRKNGKPARLCSLSDPACDAIICILKLPEKILHFFALGAFHGDDCWCLLRTGSGVHALKRRCHACDSLYGDE